MQAGKSNLPWKYCEVEQSKCAPVLFEAGNHGDSPTGIVFSIFYHYWVTADQHKPWASRTRKTWDHNKMARLLDDFAQCEPWQLSRPSSTSEQYTVLFYSTFPWKMPAQDDHTSLCGLDTPDDSVAFSLWSECSLGKYTYDWINLCSVHQPSCDFSLPK